jgi:hypothetical protein
MKTKILFSVFFLALVVTAHAQRSDFQVGLNYAYTAPAGGMKQYIRNGNGLVLSAYWTAPSQRISAGFEINWSNYGSDVSTQDYDFGDGTIAPMNIQVNNSFTNYMGNVRLYLLTTGYFRPYAELKAGYARYSTKLLVLDPDDMDSCEPVDQEILKEAGTMAYSAGGGIRIDVASMSRHGRPGRAFIDLSVNATQGGRVDYMNTDAPSNAQHHTTPRADNVETEFINTQTQVVHKHHVGYVYSSFVQSTDFRLGMSFTMGCGRQTFE